MHGLRCIVTVVTVFCLTPGAGELIENVLHLVEHGHGAHAIDDADHELQGSEHGCSGTVHLCGCCQSLAFTYPGSARGPSPTVAVSLTPASATDDAVAEGVPASTFRPPRT